MKLIWLLPIVLACAGFTHADLGRLYEWKYADYVWASDYQKTTAIEFKEYVKDSHPLRYSAAPSLCDSIDGRVLIATPKNYFDNPASLSVVSNKVGEGGPLLKPYPSWSYHKASGDCSGITSVNRIKLDACNRLWIVDSGKIKNSQVCSPQIFVFDAHTDKILQRISIPEELAHNPSDPSKGRLEIQAVETKVDSCDEFRVYIADVEGWGLVIYDGFQFWRLNDKIYAPDDGATTFSINGENVTMETGVSSVIILPDGFVKQNSILFKPMASKSGYGANLEQLRNSRSGGKVTYYKSKYTLPSQLLARDISAKGIIIAGFDGFLACWNIQVPLVDPNVVVLERSSALLPFTTSVKILNPHQSGFQDENVWVLTTNLNNYIKDTMDLNKINYHVFKGKVAKIVKGTLCEPKQHDATETLEGLSFFKIKE